MGCREGVARRVAFSRPRSPRYRSRRVWLVAQYVRSAPGAYDKAGLHCAAAIQFQRAEQEMAGKRKSEDVLLDSNGDVTDAQRHPQRKVLMGGNVDLPDCDVASQDFTNQATSHGFATQKQAPVDGGELLDDGSELQNQSDLDDGSEDALDSDNDEDSLESNVGSDIMTNVEGQLDSAWASRPKLTGVKIVEDDAADNIGMQNVARLLRRQRYHDDDISQPSTVPRISMTRCFRCLLPGHLARDCPNPAREKPCAWCAGYGHLQSHCPKSFCFRCNGFGHVLADCYFEEARKSSRVCVRCGKTDCPASGGMDWFRVHRGCKEQYTQSDLRHVRCFICGQQGHFCCEKTPLEPSYPTCCLCGRKGHTGILGSCPDPLPPFLGAEANQAQRLRDPSARSQRSRPVGHDRGGWPQDNGDGRQNRAGPIRLDTGREGLGHQIRKDHHNASRKSQSGVAMVQPAQPAARAAASNRYGPQRYGYQPADPQAGMHTSYNSGRRRHGFHDAPPSQHRVHTSGSGLPTMVAHPPPDVIAYGNRSAPGGYNAGGAHGHGSIGAPGGHTVIQAPQPWQLQQHDISSQRCPPATGARGGPVPSQRTHAAQARFTARDEAPYYMPNANGQGTHRRWK